MTKQILLKFLKAAITGGITALASALTLGVQPKNLEDVKSIGILLGFAFLSGAVHALAELLNPTVPATVVSTVVESKTVTKPTE